MNACHLIAKHLSKDAFLACGYKIEELPDGICCFFTGLPIKQGVLKKSILSSNFTDWDYCKGLGSEYVSIDVAMCLKPTLPVEEGFSELRKYSFYADEKQIKIVRAENLADVLFGKKKTPFVFCVGSLRASKAQKHVSFKSKINHSDKHFTVSTECGDVDFDMDLAKRILPTLQAWYTVTPKTKGKAQEYTYFTKDEILSGCNDLAKIQAYGVEKYFRENSEIGQYRNSFFLELIVKSLKRL